MMVGLDKSIDGNYAKWIVGAAAGFVKGDIDQDSGHVDQDSQSARIYASKRKYPIKENTVTDTNNASSLN